MIDILFWALFLIIPVAMLFLLRLAGEKINQISVVNITAISLFLFSVVGTLPLYYHMDMYRVSTGIINSDLVLEVLFYSSLNLILFLTGVVFARKVMLLNPIPIHSFEIKSLDNNRFVFLLLALVFVATVLYFYLGKIDKLAIFVALNEGPEQASVARSAMGNNFPGKYHWYSLFLNDISTIVTLSLYASWLLTKRLLMLFLFIIAFSVSAFIAIMATEKVPFVMLVMSIFMTYYFVRRNGYISKQSVLILGCVVIAILAFFYLYIMQERNIAAALWSVFSRAFSGSISPAYFYLEYFPMERDYLLGLTFPNPGGILPYTPVQYTVELMNWKFPEHITQGVVGSLPTVFWGESYANFGTLGVPILAFLMGSYVAFISYFLSKIELNPISVAFTIWIIFHLKDLSVTGFSGFLYDFYIIGVLCVTLIIMSSNGKISIRKRGPIPHHNIM